MTEAIRGDVLTRERMAHKDIRVEQSDRGGIRFYSRSYLDVLLENDIISESDKTAGMVYWSLKEAAMAFLGAKSNPLFADVGGSEGEPEEAQEPDSAAYDVYCRIKLSDAERRIINAACTTCYTSGLEIVHAWGVNRIVWAFESLQESIEVARQEAKKAQESENSACMYV